MATRRRQLLVKTVTRVEREREGGGGGGVGKLLGHYNTHKASGCLEVVKLI